MEIDDDLVGAVDDVIVGDDEAFLAVDDEAGAERGHLAVATRGAPPRLLKKSSKNSSNGEPLGTCGSGTPCGPLTVCAGRDVDDGVEQLLGERRQRGRPVSARHASDRRNAGGKYGEREGEAEANGVTHVELQVRSLRRRP